MNYIKLEKKQNYLKISYCFQEIKCRLLKDTELFKDESEKAQINQLNVKSNVKLNAKSNDSPKIPELQKFTDDAKQYDDKAKKYINKSKQYSDKSKKCIDEILKLLKTSKEPSKRNIDTSTIINTDKANITDEALKVSDSIDEKIISIEKENQIAICNDTADTSIDTSNDSSHDTKPNIV